MARVHSNRTRMKTKRQQKRARIKAMLIAGFGLLILIPVVILAVWLTSLGKQPPNTNIAGGDAGGGNAATQTPPANTKKIELILPKEFIDYNTSAEYIALYDLTNDQMLYGKNADAPCFPASTTKLLTALVTLQNADSTTVFTVGDEIKLIDPQSSVAGLHMGQQLDLRTILEAIILPSGNDAAYTAAANVGRILAKDHTLSAKAAIERFCEEMNRTAQSLGLTNSRFKNPDGIHDPSHYTTANDMAKIAKAALANPTLAEIVGEQQVQRTFLSGETGRLWANTNLLLDPTSIFYFDGATGLKTGFTSEAGHCLVASAEKDGVQMLAVVMNAPTTSKRFDDAYGLLTVLYNSIQ